MTQGIEDLANNTNDAWRNFNEKESEYITGLTEDMDEIERNIQSQSADLESLTNCVKGLEATLEREKTNEKPILRNELEDVRSQVEELSTRFRQERKQRASIFIFMILFGLMFMWLALDMRAIKVRNISTNQKISKIGDNFQKNTK